MSKTILIVDDEPHVRHMLTFKFRGAGFNVMTAANGKEAWSALCRRCPDLMVTDYQMGQHDGLELCRRIASDPRTSRLPVIMLTGIGHRLTRPQMEEANILHVMPKPFSSRELVRTVQTMLDLEPEEQGGQSGATAA